MVMIKMMKMLLSFLACFLLVTPLVYAQIGQVGFISIDCGVSTDYTDEVSGIKYVTDTTFVESGIKSFISSALQTSTLAKQLATLRSFPNGTRNCYTVRPSTAASTKFLIRARFMYGNYDVLNRLPTFDLYLGPNLWSTIEFVDSGISVSKEIIVNIISAAETSICLVNTRLGTPFISALELRPITASAYSPKYGALNLFKRYDFGSYLNYVIRYKEDVFDRLWVPFDWPEMNYINTSLTVDAAGSNDYIPPSIVMQTAVTPTNVSDPITLSWKQKDPTTEYYLFMQITEIEILQPNQTREFDIVVNGSPWYKGLRPSYLFTSTLYRDGASF